MAKAHREGRSGRTAPSVYQLKLTLIDSQPPIWRRVEIESDVTLDHLHHTLQVVMGWTNGHMHGFRVSQRAQPGTRQRLIPIESSDEKATSLSDLLRRPKDWCIYDYDFGDGWEHRLLLEKVVARSPGARYPLVLAGRGACPPEDVGGLPGYYHFLMVMNDPRHPEHEDMREWVGGSFDPTAFNAYEVNRAIHGGWGPRRPDA
jgi:hypothetical protein